MRLAVLSDAHGNEAYFNKCIAAIEKHNPDRIIFLGDCFGYMRGGDIILSKLREMKAQLLLGNHEAMLLGKLPYSAEKEEVYGLKSDRENISDSNIKCIEGLSSVLYEEMDDQKILFVHGSPDNPLNGYLYENDKLYHWEENPYEFVFMGHTHYPYLKKVGTTTYVNVGSCGLPRDYGTASSYAIFDTQTGKVVIYRILVDREEIEKVTRQKVHSSVYECLSRKGNNLCLKLM